MGQGDELRLAAKCPNWDRPTELGTKAAAAELTLAQGGPRGVPAPVRLVGPSVFVPLPWDGRLLGWIELRYGDDHRPHPDETGPMGAFGELCAAAINRAQSADADRQRQVFLLDAWAAVADAGGYGDTLRRLASVAVPRLADLCLIDVQDQHRRIRRMAAVHADPAMASLVQELGEGYPPEPGGPHPANEAIKTGRSLWSPTMPTEFLRATTRDERHFELVNLLGFRSYMCVPLIAGEHVLGAVTLVSGTSERRFSETDVALAEELATRVARVVATAQQYDREHQLVHELQRLLLPERLPYVPRAESAVRYLTAAAEAEAGGDFYDVVLLPSDRLGYMIGDVEGHDAVAAAYMGQLRSAARALAGQVREPALLVDALRWSWDLLGFGRTATAIFGRLDPSNGDLVMACAGHPPPVLVQSTGQAHFLPVEPSPPLGVPAEAATDYRMSLAEGDTVFFYTDGLVEQRDVPIQAQLDRLLAYLAQTGSSSVEDMCDGALAALASPGPRQDDIAVLALRRVPLVKRPAVLL